MTIRKLQQILTKMVDKGHGRKLVCVDKSTFNHALESDGCRIIPISEAILDTHGMLNDDGGTAFLADGTLKQRTALVIKGD